MTRYAVLHRERRNGKCLRICYHRCLIGQGMKMQFVLQHGIGCLQYEIENRLQRGGPVQVQRRSAAQQAHAVDEARKPEVMIAMHVTDKDVIKVLPLHTIALHLQLCTLAAVEQQDLAIHGHGLCRRMPAKCGQRRVVAEYGNAHVVQM